MTTTLIVLAHPDMRSFNGAWADATERAAREQGDIVLRSNLCGLNFNAVETAEHYPGWNPAAHFDPLKAQEDSANAGQLPHEVQQEIEKLKQADRIVFHFPIWWFAPPAVLKGWFDRVLVHGALHSIDQRFDTGLFKSKKALFCVTAGASQAESSFNGKEADIEMLLWPSAYTLRYIGFSVLAPKIVHGVHGYHEGKAQAGLEDRLQKVLAAQADLMTTFEALPQLSFNNDTDFDNDGRLLPNRPSHSHFIRHSK